MSMSCRIICLLLSPIVFCLHIHAQSEPSPLLKQLSALMGEIQTKAQQQARTNPDAFRLVAAGIADQHLNEIILASSSRVANERLLAASLLAIASPSDAGTERLVALASDEVLDVRHTALLSISAVTDGTNKQANEAVLKALNENGNPNLTRDAAFTASTLRLPDALPMFERLLKSDDSLNKRFAADAAARYGPLATSLLFELKRQEATIKDPTLKAVIQRAIASIDRPSDTVPEQSANSPGFPLKERSVNVATSVNGITAAGQNGGAKPAGETASSWPFAATITILVIILIAAMLLIKSKT